MIPKFSLFSHKHALPHEGGKERGKSMGGGGGGWRVGLCSNQPITDNATMATSVTRTTLVYLFWAPTCTTLPPTTHPFSPLPHTHCHTPLFACRHKGCLQSYPVDEASERLVDSHPTPHTSLQVVTKSSRHSSSHLVGTCIAYRHGRHANTDQTYRRPSGNGIFTTL